MSTPAPEGPSGITSQDKDDGEGEHSCEGYSPNDVLFHTGISASGGQSKPGLLRSISRGRLGSNASGMGAKISVRAAQIKKNHENQVTEVNTGIKRETRLTLGMWSVQRIRPRILRSAYSTSTLRRRRRPGEPIGRKQRPLGFARGDSDISILLLEDGRHRRDERRDR